MKLLVSGGTGLIGGGLVDSLRKENHKVTLLTRRASVSAPHILWDPHLERVDPRLLEGFDAVVHLAGENIAAGRWTSKVKDRILKSRSKGTAFLANTLAGLTRPPKVLISASAIGIYGDRGEESLNEESPPGTGFLAEVCRAWESSSAPAAAKGIRVAALRFGVVLSPRGGALQKMLLPFRLGLGGKIGTGRQWWSWVSLMDVIGGIRHVLETDFISGPVNVTAPSPVTNAEFTKALGRALHRPTLFPLPAFMAKMVLGEMAESLLLASARVEPKKLLSSGYVFRHSTLAGALTDLLKS
ncbi:MAG: TIGR01777 family oxidoreductase [Elusimicrobia bacterium]|nr:TIGR01777 family oxidoreductase [Elusimicrobiota bacterium]